MAKRTRSPNSKKLLPSGRVKRDPSDAARRSKQAERLGRLLRLLELLSDLRCYNLDELAGKLGCSGKTVSRYLDHHRPYLASRRSGTAAQLRAALGCPSIPTTTAGHVAGTGGVVE